jgi:hypothetical protein
MAGISQEVRNVVAKFSEWQGGVKQLSRELLNANDDNLDNELNKLTMDSKDFVCFRPKLMEFPDLIQDPLFKQCCLGYFCLCQELNKLKSFSETEIENLFLFNTTGSGLININQLLRFIRSINDDNTKFVKEILTDFGNAITQAGIDRSKENLGTSESFEKIHAALDKSIWKIFKDGYEESKSSNVELSPRIKWYIEVFKKDSFKIYNEETRPTVNSHTDKAKSPNIISNFSTNRRRAAYFSSVVDQLRKNGLEDEFWPKHVIICEFVDKCTTGMTLLFPREYSAYAPVLIGGKLGLLDRLAYFWRKCTHKLWGLRKINGPCTGESYADTLAHECGHYLHCQIVDLAAKREVFEKYAIGLENYERLSRFYTPQRYDACLNYVPRKIAPQEVAPQEVAPQEVAPQEVAPQEVAPQEVALQEVAPQEVAPQEVAPQEVAPQEVVDMRKMIMEEVSIYACSHADGSEFVAETFAILLMQKKKLSQPIIELYVALNGPIIPEIKRLIDSFGYTNIQVAVNIPETPEDVNESAEIQERSEDDRETEDF